MKSTLLTYYRRYFIFKKKQPMATGLLELREKKDHVLKQMYLWERQRRVTDRLIFKIEALYAENAGAEIEMRIARLLDYYRANPLKIEKYSLLYAFLHYVETFGDQMPPGPGEWKSWKYRNYHYSLLGDGVTVIKKDNKTLLSFF